MFVVGDRLPAFDAAAFGSKLAIFSPLGEQGRRAEDGRRGKPDARGVKAAGAERISCEAMIDKQTYAKLVLTF